MADSFKDRERGFENKWAHDEELRFKVMARRNKLLGLWAAGEMGLTGAKAEDYAGAVVAADMQEPGEEDVFRKIRSDLTLSDHMIRVRMSEFLATAADQVMNEVKK
jgi:hypothetical protein